MKAKSKIIELIEPCQKCPNREKKATKCYQGQSCLLCPKLRDYNSLIMNPNKIKYSKALL